MEFTPGYDRFAVDNLGGVALRPDALEYISISDVDGGETALYGELSFQATDALGFTLGYRHYEFETDNALGVDTPLARTVFQGASADTIDANLEYNDTTEKSELFKFNVFYDMNDDQMVYFTYSEGYRNGGVNPVPACTPERQGTFNITYERTLFEGIDLAVNYGVIYTGDVYNIVGGDRDPLSDPEMEGAPADFGGEKIPSYTLQHLSATFSGEQWMVQAYVDNLTDEYHVTGTRHTRRFLQNEASGIGGTVSG